MWSTCGLLSIEPRYFFGTDQNVSIEFSQVLKAGIECVVSFIIILFAQVVPDFNQNVLTFSLFYLYKVLAQLLVFRLTLSSRCYVD